MITQTSTTHHTGCGCETCTTATRNRFFKGKRMKAEEFTIEQRYGLERRRLLTSGVVGWGVVRGLAVKTGDTTEPSAFIVSPGFALDRHGRELVLTESAAIDAKNTFVIEDGGACRLGPIDRIEPGEYLLSVHYAERRIGESSYPDPCGCDEPEQNFVCETVVFSLTRVAQGRCPCEEKSCDRQCGRAPAEPEPAPHGEPGCGGGRGPHECLCEWAQAVNEPEPRALCDWNGYWIDPADGVALACVAVSTTGDECRPIGLVPLEACRPRRLVKTNDLLYDLIRGCDLTHISDISWKEWHRSDKTVEWADFVKRFTPPGPNAPWEVETSFIVTFSGPVLRKTLLPDIVTMTVLTLGHSSGWHVPQRIPIVRIDATTTTPLPSHLTDRMQIVVDYGWFHDEVEDNATRSDLIRPSDDFTGFVTEIEIRGDLILDCHHQAVDANAVGLRPVPTGNGTPGGTYISSFVLGPKPSGYRSEPRHRGQRHASL